MWAFLYPTISIPLSFALTYAFMPWVIESLKKKGLVGKDMNKKDKPKIPTIGGIGITIGYFAGMLLSIGAFLENSAIAFKIMAALSSILFITLLGFMDDIFDIRQIVKAILPIFAALPLVVARAGETSMGIPLIGKVDFGVVYTLIFIPIGFTVGANLPNMLAGYNGLEGGMALILIIFLSIASILSDHLATFVILAPLIGSLSAFLIFNKFPSKVFPGNVGTYVIGAVITSSVIVGNMERAGIIIFLPFAVEFFIKLKGRFKGSCFAKEVKENGILIPPEKPESLIHYVLKMKPMNEKKLVEFFWTIAVIFGALALIDVLISAEIIT